MQTGNGGCRRRGMQNASISQDIQVKHTKSKTKQLAWNEPAVSNDNLYGKMLSTPAGFHPTMCSESLYTSLARGLNQHTHPVLTETYTLSMHFPLFLLTTHIYTHKFHILLPLVQYVTCVMMDPAIGHLNPISHLDIHYWLLGESVCMIIFTWV